MVIYLSIFLFILLFLIVIYFIPFLLDNSFVDVSSEKLASSHSANGKKDDSNSGGWWLFTLVFSTIFTALMGYWFQNKLAKNKLKLERLEKRASFIKSIAKDLSDLVSKRMYVSKLYRTALVQSNLSIETRNNYKKCVYDWNNEIHGVYSSLNMYDIVDLSNLIEKNIHENFVKLHGLFVKYSLGMRSISSKDLFEMDMLIKQITYYSSYYSRVISDISNESWNKVLYKIEPLTTDNLHEATNITLIKSLFNYRRSVLGINRSLYK